MNRTSSLYKSEMKQYLRDRSYVWVYLGMISREAQDNASITSQLVDFAKDDIFGTSQFQGYYATYEENFFKADGSMYFMPEESKYYSVLNQGAVSDNAITVEFDNPYSFGGLTIDFGEVYPTEFTVNDGTETHTYQNDKAGTFIVNDSFEDVESITITPVTMVGGDQRMRIHNLIFGLGFVFDNSNLLSTRRVNEVDHLSLELPKKTFEFTIDNFKQEWTIDNPNSYAQALQEKQIVQVTYGRELPDGSIYKIPSGYMSLQSWSNTHSTATFKAVGFLDDSNTTFYGGEVSRTSLYDLAVAVCEDMGVDYKIDTFLRKLYTDNPLPIDTHKACLQMIANAGLCSMFEDGNGVITLKSSMKAPRNTITVQNAEYSNTEKLTNGDEVLNLATFEKDYFRADGSLVFYGQTDKQGVVSNIYPTNNGLNITIEFEAIWTFTGLSFQFGIITPYTVTIAEYNDNTLTETHTYDVNDTNFYIDYEFYEVDKLVITFANPDDTRIHLNKLLIGTITDYEIAETDMSELPTATQTERVKSINIKYYEFVEGTKKVKAQTTAEEGENLVTFKNPCFGYSIEGCTITDSGAYYVVFEAEDAGKVTIEATEYEKVENTYSYQIRRTGQDVVLENDLISDADLAERVCEWLAEFYSGEVDYSISYRGEPALESGDRIYLENRFVNSNLILVTSEELTTGAGMSLTNTITARQISYKT